MLMSLSLMLHVCHCATSWHISLAHRFTGVLCIKSNFCHCILAQQGLPIPSNSPSLREDAPYNLCKLKIQTGIQMLQKFAQAVFVTCLPWFTDFCQNQIQHEPGKVGWLPRPGICHMKGEKEPFMRCVVSMTCCTLRMSWVQNITTWDWNSACLSLRKAPCKRATCCVVSWRARNRTLREHLKGYPELDELTFLHHNFMS